VTAVNGNRITGVDMRTVRAMIVGEQWFGGDGGRKLRACVPHSGRLLGRERHQQGAGTAVGRALTARGRP